MDPVVVSCANARPAHARIATTALKRNLLRISFNCLSSFATLPRSNILLGRAPLREMAERTRTTLRAGQGFERDMQVLDRGINSFIINCLGIETTHHKPIP